MSRLKDKEIKQLIEYAQCMFDDGFLNWTYEDFYHRGKEAWNRLNNKFMTKHTTKNNRYPSFNSKKTVNKWIKPDSAARTSPRLFARTSNNAKAFNYKK